MLTQIKKLIHFIFYSNEKIIFKLIDITRAPNTSYALLRYQSIGKSTTSCEPIENVFNDLAIIEGFSKKDSSIILDAYESERNIPHLKLKNVIFDKIEPSFLIEDTLTRDEFSLSLKFISINNFLISYFCSTDIQILLNLIYENSLIAEKEKLALKKKNKNKLTLYTPIRT